ncbi:MAG: IS4 family transposase [Terriglobales bacterium]
MNSGRTVFSQLIEHLPEKEFQKCVARHRGDSNFRGFSCWDQLLAMAFAQLTYRESLRDIESCLRALQSKLYHMGFRGKVSRSTLADANESHDWRIFADFAQGLIATARPLHACDLMGVDLHQSLYALDSTTIDLCLSLFPWAKFRQRKAAVKLHTLLDLHGNIPTFIRVTSGAVHDVNVLDEIMPEAGAFYVMDRAYIDFQRLFVFTLSSAFFVVRTKSNVLLERRYSHPVDKSTGVLSDQTVILSSVESATAYPDPLRKVSYFDAERSKRLKFLTNNFTLPARTIADIYRQRWQVELFFKWIKQHLRIKAFYGTSENAVKTQIWIAVSIYVLVAIVRKRLGLEASLYQILQILSVTLFEKTPILRALQACDFDSDLVDIGNQLILFTF